MYFRLVKGVSWYTGIPDPGSSEPDPTPPATKGKAPASGPQAPDKAPQTSKDSAHQDSTRKPVSVGKLVKSMTTPVPSYAAVAATKDSSPPLPPSNVSKSQSVTSAPTEVKVHFPATDYRERLPPKVPPADPTSTQVKGATPLGRPNQGPPLPGPSKDPIQLVASPELLQQLLESPEMAQYLLRMSDSTKPDRPK